MQIHLFIRVLPILADVTQGSSTDGVSIIQGGYGGTNTAGVYQGAGSYNNYVSIVQDTTANSCDQHGQRNSELSSSGGNNLAMVHQH